MNGSTGMHAAMSVPYPMAARSRAACCLACCTTMGPRLRTRNTEETAAAIKSDNQHTTSEGYKHTNYRKGCWEKRANDF